MNSKEQMFKELRHLVGTMHKLPEHVSLIDLAYVLAILKDDKIGFINEFFKENP